MRFDQQLNNAVNKELGYINNALLFILIIKNHELYRIKVKRKNESS